MTTARDIITDALRKIHVLGKGSSLDNDEAQDALGTLNQMLSSISVQGGYVYAETKETFNLGSAISYTIGSGGDFNTTRPVKITSMYTTLGDIDYPTQQISNTEYSYITSKDVAGGNPYYFYYDGNYPLGRIYFYPQPIGGTVTINSLKQLSSFTTLDTTFVLPPEYEAMLVYNLATWIAPEYEREASASVQRIAKQTKNNVLIQNSQKDYYTSSINVPSRNAQYGNILQGFD
jgi:hypothetical protein